MYLNCSSLLIYLNNIIYHLNVCPKTGNICLRPLQDWEPTFCLTDILNAIYSLLIKPEESTPYPSLFFFPFQNYYIPTLALITRKYDHELQYTMRNNPAGYKTQARRSAQEAK